jgi:hypothetical protein
MDLRIAAREAKVQEAESLRDFLDIYTLCDEKRCAAENRTRSIIDESYRKNKNNNKENAFHPYKKDGRPSSTSAAQTSSTTGQRPPKLTPLEIEIIKSCSGCFKCRKIYQSKDHINAEASKKTCEFPPGENYRALTWEYANKVKAIREARKASAPTKAIASTSSAPPTASTTSSSLVEVNTSNDSDFIASIFGPLASSSVIGNGSFSSDGDSSVCQPFKSKHYVWKCKIDGTLDKFPLTVSTLIDNGAHMVLIRPETVKQLGLASFPLPQPETIDVAISSSGSTKKTLSHFVKFKATSLDGLWTSRTVFAIIAPGLCMPIIFGLPFLEFNEIISDHSRRSCIHKKSGYNLINPAIPTPPSPPRPKLKEQLKSNRRFKAEALKNSLTLSTTNGARAYNPMNRLNLLTNLKQSRIELPQLLMMRSSAEKKSF